MTFLTILLEVIKLVIVHSPGPHEYVPGADVAVSITHCG